MFLFVVWTLRLIGPIIYEAVTAGFQMQILHVKFEWMLEMEKTEGCPSAG